MWNSQSTSGFWDLLLFMNLACISCISACHLRCFFPRNLCSRSSDCFRSTWTRRKTRQSIKNQFFCSGIINQMHKQPQHWHLAGLMFKTCGNYSSPENRLASKSHKSLWLWRKWELAEKNWGNQLKYTGSKEGREKSDWLELPRGEETGSRGHSFTELVVSVTWNQNKAGTEVKDFL